MENVEANIDFKLIGDRIKEARIKKGYSMDKLAKKMNVTDEYLAKVERGSTTITLKRLGQIALILDEPLEELVTGIIKEDKRYLNKEFFDLLEHCSKDKQKLIYGIAKIVVDIKFI